MAKQVYSRRSFLQTSAALTLAGSSGVARAAKKGDRPNILFVFTDQQFAGAMSCAGNSDLKTPAMDRIAAEGTLFKKAYCANPVCVPSRVSMFNGRMPHEMGVYQNIRYHRSIENFPMMGKVFRDAGYDMGYVGKWHLLAREGDEDVHGFDRHVMAIHKDPDTPKDCATFLKQKRDKPFFLVASLINPHDICQWARGDSFKNGAIGEAPAPEQCPELPMNHAIPDHEPDIIRKVQAQYSERLYPTRGWEAGKWRQYRWAYYRMVELVDRRIGEILDALEETGQTENTVIVFTSDHGDGHGAHHWNQKQVLYDEVARVPMMVAWKGKTKPGVVDTTQLVSTGLDIFPTLCDFSGVQPPEGLRGVSLRKVAEEGGGAPLRDFVVCETEFGRFGDHPPFEHKGPMGRMVRTAKYKYIVYSEGKLREQLFDMETDAGEMNNLAVNPEFESVLKEHRNILAGWCEETEDDFPVIG